MLIVSAALDSRLVELLAAPAPALSCDVAQQIAREHFGVSGAAAPLGGERDQNFHIQTPQGPGFVLKIANPLEHSEVTDFQTQALARIAAREPDLPVPRVCATTSGAAHASINIGGRQQSTVRLLTYLPGVPLAEAPSTPRLRARLGACLARMDRALGDFSHPGADRGLLWNMVNAADLAELMRHIPDAQQRSIVARYIERFANVVLPSFPALRWQVIYNDLNPGNVLVDPHEHQRLAGIIDFGDMCRAPLVVDVAIAAAYQLRYTADPFEAATQLVASYHRETPLEDREVDLLYDLVATRLASAIVITAWHSTLHPDNRDYIMRNAGSNCDLLKRIDETSRGNVQKRMRMACQTARPGL